MLFNSPEFIIFLLVVYTLYLLLPLLPTAARTFAGVPDCGNDRGHVSKRSEKISAGQSFYFTAEVDEELARALIAIIDNSGVDRQQHPSMDH
jgi:hypothetical protein